MNEKERRRYYVMALVSRVVMGVQGMFAGLYLATGLWNEAALSVVNALVPLFVGAWASKKAQAVEVKK